MQPIKKIFFSLFVLFFFCSHLSSQHAAELLEDCDQIFKNHNEINVIFDRSADLGLQEISTIGSIDHGTTHELVYLNIAEENFQSFLSLDISFTIDTEYYAPRELRMLDEIIAKDPNGCLTTTWDFYPTYEAYIAMMEQFALDYPEICQLERLGVLSSGREIIALKISDNVAVRENEPKFLYTSTMHGDETSGYPLLLRLSDYLLCNYDADDRITDLVNNIEIWINPLANPDGTYRTGNNSVEGASRRNANNRDLNRNFPDPEDGPHPDGFAYQEETEIFMELAEQDFNMSGNFHGGAEVFNYPWDTYERRTADDSWWNCQGRMFADTIHAHSPQGYFNDLNNGVTNGYDWYEVNGGRQDFMTHDHHGREFTLEISNQKLLDSDELPNHWEYNYRSFLNYLEGASLGLKGVITDSQSGEPIEAEVFITGHDNDNSQVYSKLPHGGYFRYLDDGNYDITYSAEGYISQTFATGIDKTELVIQDVSLEPESVSTTEIPDDELFIYVTNHKIIIDNQQSEKQFSLLGIDGKRVFLNMDLSIGNNEINLNPEMASGIYIVHITDGNRHMVKRIVL